MEKSPNKPFINSAEIDSESVAQVDREIGVLQNSFQKDPTNFEIPFKLGTLFLKRGRIADAIHALEQCLRLKPDHTESSYLLGNAYIGHKQYELAARYYMKTLRSNPNHVPSLYNIATCYLELGLQPKAILAFKKFFQLETSTEWREEARYQLYKLGIKI